MKVISSHIAFGAALATFMGIFSPETNAGPADLGSFFEPGFPFYQSPLEFPSRSGENFAVRGIVCPLAGNLNVAFDQDLLRLAGFWTSPKGQPVISLLTMAQVSYADSHHKANSEHPRPNGPVHLGTGLHPGVAISLEALFADPRAPSPKGELGRGPLPAKTARFEGIQTGATGPAILRYTCGGTAISEWYEARQMGTKEVVVRHLEVGAHRERIYFAIGSSEEPWQLMGAKTALAKSKIAVLTNEPALELITHNGELVAQLAPGPGTQKVSMAFVLDPDPDSEALRESLPASAPAPESGTAKRWPQEISASVRMQDVVANGLALDRIEIPENNPWKRKIRTADIAFLSPDRAAVVTYDGDVWLVDGLKASAVGKLTWKRFASGLSEPLSLAVIGDVVQVATKNGLVRLRDRDNNGEADWYENFSDLVRQSQSTRSFPLDMDVGPDGSTYVSQGGIAMGGAGNEFTGAITRFAPDGRSIEIFSTHAREPYVTVNPKSGVVTGTDQQGHFIPSSPCYLIRRGDNFGFGEVNPAKLTPPLVWIPHTVDNSSSSEVWIQGEGMGALNGGLLHLSYGSGGFFLISPDLEAPIPQGAVIPMQMDTNIPLLQGRMHPDGNALFVCGFQIYDSRTSTNWGLARVRLAGSPIATPVEARSCSKGLLLRFAVPLNPASVTQDNLILTQWNYKRSASYGSPNFKLNGQTGTDPVSFGQVLLSEDRKSVFVHVPDLRPVMQLELRHEFALADGTLSKGSVYFTIHQARELDLARAGFKSVDFSKSKLVTNVVKEETPTAELGKALSQSMGCIACHSADGTSEGKTGPTWKGLFGTDRTFTDGSVESANEFYIRDSILEPQRKVVAGFPGAMASYKGILNESQLQSIIMYIRTLKTPAPPGSSPGSAKKSKDEG